MNPSPRVLVCGYSEVGTACLEALLDLGANVVGLFTHRDDPKENRWFRTPAPVAEAAGGVGEESAERQAGRQSAVSRARESGSRRYAVMGA